MPSSVAPTLAGIKSCGHFRLSQPVAVGLDLSCLLGGRGLFKLELREDRGEPPQ